MTFEEPKVPRTTLFTSGRMEAVWEIAHREGYTNLKDFWEYADTQDWDFYDVLDIASP
jgi:hypothetical protein